jgi:hypothetical protein
MYTHFFISYKALNLAYKLPPKKHFLMGQQGVPSQFLNFFSYFEKRGGGEQTIPNLK